MKGRIICSSEKSLPPIEEIRETASEDGAVINFPKGVIDIGKMINFLQMELTWFTVFSNGGSSHEDSITVLPVISIQVFNSNKARFVESYEDYDLRCRELIGNHNAGTLKEGWKGQRHGMHICFTNKFNSMTVEAPLDPDRQGMDPYFLSKFIKSCDQYKDIALLIKNDFHDGARILQYISELNQ